ncbi:MAG: TerC family protein [Acidobacteria bacterium]|nr:TerC family protein [Acidobacteriota bacterium]
MVAASTAYAHFDVPVWAWIAFVGFVVAIIATDILVVHRGPRELSLRTAALESGVWLTMGLAFALVVLAWHGGRAAGEYLSGYLIEESLSVDNVFVWAVILTFFAVPLAYRFRVLFWGIAGALVLRALFILGGVALVNRFEFVLYGFGAFLLYTAWRIGRHDEAEVHPDRNLAMRAVRRLVPSTAEYDGQRLFTVKDGRRLATPLFAVVVMVAATDVLFAVDSIPAVIAVSREQFIVVSSNAMALLGLRSLYFCLQGMAGRFRYLNVGLGVILAFVGTKMIVETADVVHVPTWASLAVITATLLTAVSFSARADRHDGRNDGGPIEELVERSLEHEQGDDG